MTIHIHPDFNNRFRTDLKYLQKKSTYKAIYDNVIEPFLEKVGECLCDLVCLSKVLKHKDFKKLIGANIRISNSDEWSIFKCRVTPGTKGKRSALRLVYISFAKETDTVPVPLYQHGDKQSNLTAQQLLTLAKKTLEGYVSAKLQETRKKIKK